MPSEETRKGMTEKAEQGIWPSYAPFGYRNVSGRTARRLSNRTRSLRRSSARCSSGTRPGGIPSGRSPAWPAARGSYFARPATRCPQSSVHKMLRNCIYMGEFVWDEQDLPG